MGERIILDITGTSVLPEDGFEPSDIVPEGEVIKFQGTVVGNNFNRQIPSLEPEEMMWEARQEVGVARDETEDEVENRPFNTHVHPHQQDFPVIPMGEYQETDEAVLGCPALKTAKREKASRLRSVDVDKAVLEAGGDPKAQVPKPEESFSLKP